MRELSFSAVDDDHLWQGLSLFLQAFVPAVHGLLHAGKVVWAFHRSDVEFPVISFGGFAIPEHDTRGGWGGALDVAVVEALHVNGVFFETQVVHHGLHEPFFCGVWVHLLQLRMSVPHGKLGIAQAHVQQFLFVPSLRHQTLGPQQLQGHVHLGKDGAAGHVEAVPYLRDGRLQHLGIGFIQSTFEFEGLPLNHGTVVDAHEIHKRRFGIAHEPIHFHVGNGRVDHRAFGLELGHGFQLELEPFCLFKPKVVGGGRHGAFQGSLHLSQVAAKHVSDGGDAFVVGLFRLLPHTRPQAVPNMVLKAYPKLARGDVFFRQGQAARAHRIELLAQVQHGVHPFDM